MQLSRKSKIFDFPF